MKKKYELTPEIKALLGTVTDMEIGRRFGIPREKISEWRNILCIDTFISRPSRRYDYTEADKLIGTTTDRKVSEITGIPLISIIKHRKMRGIPAFINKRQSIVLTEEKIADLKILGVSHFAKKHKMSTHTVYTKRAELGIKLKKFARISGQYVPDWVYPILGQFLDSHIAKAANVSHERIRQLRVESGIPTPNQLGVCQRYFDEWRERNNV